MIKDDPTIFGLLTVLLWAIFYTSHSKDPSWQRFYKFVPALFLVYFLPSLLVWPLGVIDPKESNLYYMTSRYLLPASLVYLCCSVNFREIRRLGPKALIMFLTATLSIMLGGPVALMTVQAISPGSIGGEDTELWRGLSTVAGSWIGGGANQTAMKEIFEVADDLFASMLVVDILVANVLLGLLLYLTRSANRIDAFLGADSSPIESLKKKMTEFKESVSRKADTMDFISIAAVGFGATALAHFAKGYITEFMKGHADVLVSMNLHSLLSPFFWLIVLATAIGLIMSLTKARSLQGVGTNSIASLFIYLLMMTIGMKMNILEIFEYPQLFAIGFIWICFHLVVLFVVAKLIKAPFFFIAVGSQANVGGAATAPAVAGAFHSSLAPVGALLAVLGYILGTYGAILCALMMQAVSR